MRNIGGWKKYTLLYLVLLGISHLVIWTVDTPIIDENTPSNEVTVQVVLENHSLSNQEIRIGYEDIYTGDKANPPVLLLLPGGLEGPEVFKEVKSSMAKKFRLIIPHLPGYGNSNGKLPDYSFKTLSVYTNQILDQLELSDVHVLGYGLGGASAIYLAHDYPEKVQSLSLVSSIGVQELELLGSYRLNHAVHGVQLSAVWLLHNAIPHFGLLNALNIDVSYAKSHYESDQRPLRSYLKKYQKPMLIMHGKDDPLVPLAAAKEHYRIVPQSVLKTYNGDHDLIETHSDSITTAVKSFISDIEQGNAIRATNASKERVEEAKKPFSNIEFAKFKGISLLIIMLIIMFSTLISEDLTCIGAGLLAARGLIGFWPATLACLLGIFIGDMGLYLAGRVLGRPALRRAPFKWIISEKDLENSSKWFNRKGPAIIIATRFLPGSRLPTYFSAGVIGAGFWMFSLYFLLAAIVWTPMLVGISKFLGNELLQYFNLYKDYAIWVFLGAIIFLIMIVKIVIPVFSYKGRRLLVSRYRRLTRWEYWSPFVLYAPVFCYVIYLGIKYRCLTLFTAANPAIPDSGFVGESKTAILELFENGQYIASYQRISSESDIDKMLEKAEQFMQKEECNFPIVLKPDVGQRGKGVEIIRSRESMEAYFSKITHDIIIQEYIEGKEYGVFYYQKPEEPQGNIFSITNKELLCVTGDGEKTLQELILEDDQAVNLAKFHLKENEDRLYEIPEKGESVPIVELGTHARGALFGDGQHLISDELISTMNAICQPVSGYFFGRFDIKVPSAEHLTKGEHLKVIEVNGVTSESTNIYDEKYSFFDAQGILFKQWKLAFEVGHQNKKNGANTSAIIPFIRRVFSILFGKSKSIN